MSLQLQPAEVLTRTLTDTILSHLAYLDYPWATPCQLQCSLSCEAISIDWPTYLIWCGVAATTATGIYLVD